MRPIDADALLEYWRDNGVKKYLYDTRFVLDSIDNAPTLDLEPVRHGRWEKRTYIIFDTERDGYHCTACRTTWDTPTPFCPNCGAKMDLEERK